MPCFRKSGVCQLCVALDPLNVCAAANMLTQRLEQWLDSVGISIQTDRVRIRAADGGLGVFAVKTVHEGDSLCSIPKAAVLSVKTSGVAGLLEENKIRGGLGLIIAVLYEMSLHAASPWYELPTASLYVAWSWHTHRCLHRLQVT